MFLAPLIRWLVNHHNPRMAFAATLGIACAAVAIGAVGISTRQPAVTRIGVLLVIVCIAVIAIRSRRDRSSERDRNDKQSGPDQPELHD